MRAITNDLGKRAVSQTNPAIPKDLERELKIQFASQLYQRTLKQHGEDHEQTRLLREYLAAFERRKLA